MLDQNPTREPVLNIRCQCGEVFHTEESHIGRAIKSCERSRFLLGFEARLDFRNLYGLCRARRTKSFSVGDLRMVLDPTLPLPPKPAPNRDQRI
jgi:hypothetical protein